MHGDHHPPAPKGGLVSDSPLPEFVTYSLDLDKISLIEKADDALLILVRICRFESPTANIPYETLPLGIIVVGDSVVTIRRHEHELLRDLPQEHQADLSTANPMWFVLHLLWSVANNYLRHLSDIDKTVEAIEDRLQRSLQNREVRELLRYQKSLVHFTTALRANETMLERCQRGGFLEMERGDEGLLDDVFTESRQAIGMRPARRRQAAAAGVPRPASRQEGVGVHVERAGALTGASSGVRGGVALPPRRGTPRHATRRGAAASASSPRTSSSVVSRKSS